MKVLTAVVLVLVGLVSFSAGASDIRDLENSLYSVEAFTAAAEQYKGLYGGPSGCYRRGPVMLSAEDSGAGAGTELANTLPLIAVVGVLMAADAVHRRRNRRPRD